MSKLKQLAKKAREENRRRKAAHKAELEEKFGVVGHPKAGKLYALAWKYGAAWEFEIESVYLDLVELIK